MKKYISSMRAKIGPDSFIHPAARIIVENAEGQVLFIERRDNGKLGIPAGAFEEGESIEACIKREVREETGLELLAVEVIGISSQPSVEAVQYPNGDQIQYFTVEFYANQWEGSLAPQDKEEVKVARFMDASLQAQLPPNEQSAFQSLAHYRETGKVRLA